MTTEPDLFFSDNFRLLTGRLPYPWQSKLFRSFIVPAGATWPEEVDLPTGAGKTAVVYIWLIALAWSTRSGAHSVPRRLAWIVNRRVVVDQVTTELTTLLGRLSDGKPEMAEFSGLLAWLSLSGTPLAISTLRGQHADKGEWGRDPSTPAVVVGTVDMIGSRLLFRGYRAGPYHRPMHAGMLGVDTLVVNDEAHLSPALAQLLEKVRDRAPASLIPGKSFRILVLSATPDRMAGLRRFEHDPAEDVAGSSTFSGIFNAPKLLVLREAGSANEFDAVVWSLATEAPAPRTAIFIEQPEKAAKLAERLEKDGRPCALLTGTMRGFERDRLLDSNESFRRFLDTKPDGDPVWLVCTSAGEVGINFSCERMITGLYEADHLLQRFGRLNRFGGPDPGVGYVVFRDPPEKDVRLRETLSYLRALDGDISCAKLWQNRPPIEARSERPVTARVEDRHIDLWAQTTQHDRFVPPVASWLHGKQDAEAPETEVAWRSDVGILTEWGVDAPQMAGILEYYPVLTRERLSEPAHRVAGKLAEIQAQIGIPEASKKRVIVVESDGSVSVLSVAQLAERTERDKNYLGNKMLLLPDGLGSVRKGMFHSASRENPDETFDVGDPETGELIPGPVRIRFEFKGGVSKRLPTHATSADEIPGPNSLDSSVLADFAAGRYRPALVVRHPNSENDDRALVYFGARSLGAWKKPTRNVLLDDHQASVAATAKRLVESVGLSEFADQYKRAGEVHDSGKARSVWQRAMGWRGGPPIAKTKAAANLRLIAGYRHELGSLLDALKGGESDDLLLHLVASHHAAARPFFHNAQYDPTSLKTSGAASAEAARRYARLQARYGHWGLAYLEAVFKCADGIVSGEEGDPQSA